MPRSSDPAKYPSSFHAMLERILTTGVEIRIPSEHPKSLQGTLQSFLLAVETSPDHPYREQVKSLMVRRAPEGDAVILCDRDASPYALAVAAALGESGETPDEEMKSLEQKLLKRGG